MDDGGSGNLRIIVFLVLLALDFIYNGYEAAARALGRKEEEDDSDRVRRLMRAVSDLTDTGDSVQAVRAAIHLLMGAAACRSIMETVFDGVFRTAVQSETVFVLCRILAWIIAAVIMVVIILVIGIRLPSGLGSRNPEKWTSVMVYPVWLIAVISLPFRKAATVLTAFLLRVFGIKNNENEEDLTEEEILNMVNEGHEHGVIQQTEVDMISNIFEFSDKEANDIMTHRNEMIAVDRDTSLNDAIAFMLSRRNSRFPVYEENIDHIVGIIHMRDAVKYREGHPEDGERMLSEIADICREPVFVAETKNIDSLFKQMQTEKLQMVIVIDEYGQTAGLVAMEDILEEIVGNIMDEYDVDENHISSTANPNEFFVDGRTPLEEITDRFGIEFDDDRFETLNGFMISQMDRIPEQNNHFTCEYEGYRFHVVSVENRQVKRVMLTKINQNI